MDRGRIQEQGTHDELFRLERLYYELCSTQGIINNEPNSRSSVEESKFKTL
jgi:ABC-type transport system involved in cytochrome bd biosynthesis fused ATPase/permease subunit